MHDNQLALTPPIAARLIHEQVPDADEPITPLTTGGTDSHIYRIGTTRAARFPLHRDDVRSVRARLAREHAAMAEFAQVSGVACPLPVTIGEPGHGFPAPWSVQTWIDGAVADPTSHARSTSLAVDLGRLIGRLRNADARGRTFTGGGRGGVLASHDTWVEHCIRMSDGLLDVDHLRRAWSSLRATPRHEPDVMAHGDLIPPNLLVRSGRLVGVLDTGGFGAADPALDLVVAWHLFDVGGRSALRAELGVDDDEWRRGAAWALQQALGLVWYYLESHPAMARLGHTAIRRLLTDAHLDL